jgi:hypothetical protein
VERANIAEDCKSCDRGGRCGWKGKENTVACLAGDGGECFEVSGDD